MVNETGTPSADPRTAERALALSYAPADRRPALAALLALDDTLATLMRRGREPLVRQMRLTWWHEALAALDDRAPPAEPVLATLSATVLPRGVSGAAMATLVDGWEALLEEPLDAGAIAQHGAGRGGLLFRLAAAVLGAEASGVAEAGEGWALADLARHLTDPGEAALARVAAAERLAAAPTRWPRALRSLGSLALLARADLAGSLPGAPGRVMALARLRLLGR